MNVSTRICFRRSGATGIIPIICLFYMKRKEGRRGGTCTSGVTQWSGWQLEQCGRSQALVGFQHMSLDASERWMQRAHHDGQAGNEGELRPAHAPGTGLHAAELHAQPRPRALRCWQAIQQRRHPLLQEQ